MNQTEQTIIACLFHYPDTIPSAVESITPENFENAHARAIYETLIVLHATGQDITIPALGAKLSQPAMSALLDLDEPATGELIKSALRKLSQSAALRSMSDLSEQIKYAIEQGNDTASLVAELAHRQAGVPDTLTIYGVDKLSAAGQVLVFFDKPSAKLAEKVIPQIISLAVTNNIKKLSKINWSVLAGRKIVIWRGDNLEAADHLYHLVTKAGAVGARVVRSPSERARDFGIIEAHEKAGWGSSEILTYIKANLYDPAMAEADAPEIEGYPPYSEHDSDPIPEPTDAPFQCLGYEHNVYYYLPRGSNQVIPLRAEQHGKSHLITLAPINYWEACYPSKAGANYDSAANALIRFQERKGVYDPSRLRGRGAWEDAGRSVLHLGNLMYVNGSQHHPHEIKSHYIYEAAPSMEYDTPCKALGTTDANRFVALCDQLMWERPIYGRLLAGWCIIAPICGALKWRPHVHLTGGAGVGKSWVQSNIVALSVGPAALQVVGSTTAAAIRQTLGADARPVIHDEFEAEEQIGMKRIQEEFELARACSSDSEALTLKGGADGRAKVYRSRAAFCFSSIGVNMSQQADVSRVTVLSLRKDEKQSEQERQAHFDKLVSEWSAVMTEEYCCALRARTVHLIPTIRKNAETFARAAAVGVGTQRTGDQLGAMMAGVYSLFSGGEIKLEQAKEWISSQDWSEYAVKEDQMDEHRCLAKILQTVIRAQGEKGICYDQSIGELIGIAQHGLRSHEGISDMNADAVLKRTGIKVDAYGETFAISNTHIAIEKILEKTPWSKNWPQLLSRLPNAEKTGSIRFGAISTKAVQLPLGMLE